MLAPFFGLFGFLGVIVAVIKCVSRSQFLKGARCRLVDPPSPPRSWFRLDCSLAPRLTRPASLAMLQLTFRLLSLLVVVSPVVLSVSQDGTPIFVREEGRCAMRDSCGRKSVFSGEIPCPDNGQAAAVRSHWPLLDNAC